MCDKAQNQDFRVQTSGCGSHPVSCQSSFDRHCSISPKVVLLAKSQNPRPFVEIGRIKSEFRAALDNSPTVSKMTKTRFSLY
jgi:hypothetical protein